MPLLELPHELLLEIWDAVDTEASMNALIQTCRYIFDNFNPRLYHYIVHETSCVHPLLWATQRGPEATMQKLLVAGVDPTERDWGFPLASAAKFGRHHVVQLLLQHGFDPNKADNCGQTPLHHAAINGHREVATTLLEAGADLSLKDHDGFTASSLAVRHGSTSVLALLLDNGASLEFLMEDGETPLLLAARVGYTDMVSLLLERNVAVDERSGEMPGNPLSWAARRGNEEIVRQLLKAGANIESIVNTNTGENVLHWAASGGQASIVALLLEKGAAPDIPDNSQRTALSWACSARSASWEVGGREVVEILLRWNVGLEIKNEDGRTPLSIAAVHGYDEAVGPLLEKGADPTTTDRDGCTPLALAAQYGHAKTVLALLNHGTPSDTQSSRCVATQQDEHRDCLQYIDTPDHLNRTPLFFATLYGHEAIVRMLLRRGSSAIQSPTIAGRSALSVAGDYTKSAQFAGIESLQSIWKFLCSPSEANVDMNGVETSSKTAKDVIVDASCDRCSVPISRYDTHFHCVICHDGNFDICMDCIGSGATCLDATHTLQKTGWVEGSWRIISDEPIYQSTMAVALR